MDHHGGGTAQGHKQSRHHDLFHLLFHIRTFSIKNYRQSQHTKNLAAKKVPKQIYFKGPDLGIRRGPRKAPLLTKIKANKSIPQ